MSNIFLYGEYYPCIQINGQRISGPCENWEKFNRTPNEQKEIFISGLPRHINENGILPIFARIGPIWKFRLMMNFSGQNRGFAYLQYVHEENHELAINFLNGKISYYGEQIRITMSRNLCTLVMGGINPMLNKMIIRKEIGRIIPLKESQWFWIKMELVLFLNFHTHRDAALSRRILLSCLWKFGHNSFVRWFEFQDKNYY